MLGQPADLSLWEANVEVANLVQEYVTGDDRYDYKSATLSRYIAKVESEIASFAEGGSKKSAESLYKSLNKIQLLMDMNFIEYTPSD